MISSAEDRPDKELADEVILWNSAITSCHVPTPKECLRRRLAKHRIKLTDFFTHCIRLYFEIRHEILFSDTVCEIVVLALQTLTYPSLGHIGCIQGARQISVFPWEGGRPWERD